MKQYRLSFADSMKHEPEHPERTAMRAASSSLDFDMIYQIWPSRGAMLKTIELQGRREERRTDWHDCMIRVRSLAAKAACDEIERR